MICLETPAVIYSEDYLKLNFGPNHPFQPSRFIATLKAINKFLSVNVFSPARISWKLLVELRVHSQKYINRVMDCSKLDILYLSEYSTDTPCFEGIFEWALSYCGGTIKGLDLLMENKHSVVFNIAGGYHHAKFNSDGGFCVFNDCALAIRYLKHKDPSSKPLYLDIDAHAGDGTYMILYDEPIPKISIHENPEYLYPGIGFVDEVGEGDGYGFTINIPLPPYSGDIEFISVIDRIVMPIIRNYQPTTIILQAGVDGYFRDPLTHLNYTYESYKYLALQLRKLGIPIFICPGGGYSDLAPELHTLLLGYLSFQEGNIEPIENILRNDGEKLKRKPYGNLAEKIIDKILNRHPIWKALEKS